MLGKRAIRVWLDPREFFFLAFNIFFKNGQPVKGWVD
jgi:hypothetical protein